MEKSAYITTVPSTGSHLLLTSHSLLLLHRHHPLAAPPAQQHTLCKKERCHQPKLRHKDRHYYLVPTTAPRLHIREHRLHSTVRAHLLLCPAHLSITQMPPTAQTTGSIGSFPSPVCHSHSPMAAVRHLTPRRPVAIFPDTAAPLISARCQSRWCQ